MDVSTELNSRGSQACNRLELPETRDKLSRREVKGESKGRAICSLTPDMSAG
jgi:hypothetical protein